MGIDAAYGSSAFGIVITQFVVVMYKYFMQKNTKDLTLMKCYQKHGIYWFKIQYKKYTLMVLIPLS
jgi:hypothetical protein